jgi:hypothetical protein
MTGAEALDHMAGIYEEPLSSFAHLREAINEGRVLGRWRGRERAREFWVSRGVAGGIEVVPRVDDSWRDKFIYIAPERVDLKEFGEQSEVHRESLTQTFPTPRERSAPKSQRRMSEAELRSRVQAFIKTAADSQRTLNFLKSKNWPRRKNGP